MLLQGGVGWPFRLDADKNFRVARCYSWFIPPEKRAAANAKNSWKKHLDKRAQSALDL